MKVSEMTARQKNAFYNIKAATNELIGSLENTLADFPLNTPEYKNADELLCDHEALANEIYNMAISDIYDMNLMHGDIREIRFCGSDWLMKMCRKRVKKEVF